LAALSSSSRLCISPQPPPAGHAQSVVGKAGAGAVVGMQAAHRLSMPGHCCCRRTE
jgi:hypothetical protein